jgi:hypothetical protein
VKRALAALALLCALAAPAMAGPVEVSLGPATIALDPAWTGDPAGDVSPVLVRTSGAAVLTVSRLAAPNPAAWRSATRDAYIDAVEAGFLVGATRVATKRRKLGTDAVNVLDLTLRRPGPTGPEVVAIRVLFFRTLTMAAAAAAPDTRSNRKRLEAAVSGLLPTAR